MIPHPAASSECAMDVCVDCGLIGICITYIQFVKHPSQRMCINWIAPPVNPDYPGAQSRRTERLSERRDTVEGGEPRAAHSAGLMTAIRNEARQDPPLIITHPSA